MKTKKPIQNQNPPKRRHNRRLEASGKVPLAPFFFGEPAALELTAAESGDGGKPKVRAFSMTAYTGGAMRLSGYYWPVVVDLAGVQVRSQTRPILYYHNVERIVGHTESIEVTSQRIKVAGKLSGVGDDVTRVTATADNGFPWQASIGADPLQMEFVDRGNTVKVNGRNFDGPVYVARKTSLREISFVALGADDSTTASIAATNPTLTKEPTTMGFSAWLKANGWDESSLSEPQLATLKAAYESSLNPAPGPGGNSRCPEPGKTSPGNNGPIQGGQPGFDPEEFTRKSRELQAQETERVTGIRAAIAKGTVQTIKVGDKDVSLEAHAIREGWTADQVELHVLRASRPTGPAIHMAPSAPSEPVVLEAALCKTAAFPGIEKSFKPEVLEAADRHYRGFGIQQLLLIAAMANGYIARPGERISAGNLRTIMQFAFPSLPLQAASAMDVSGILSNVANKELLAGYVEESEEWREISAIKTVTDFKSVTSYRMLDNFEYEEVGADGQITHGELGEESYTRQAKTYAKMFALTRTDIINDDLGALDDVRTRLGRGGKKKFNNIFWKKFLDNSAFFTAGRGNFISGGTTNLGLDGVGLEQTVTAFRKLKSPAKDGAKKVGTVGGRPDRLIVPPELEFIADRLYASAFVNTGGAATATSVPDANIHAKKYRPVVVNWLSDTAFTGNSATAFYLLRNPMDMAAMVVSFLNGNQTPIVESAEAAFNTLGIEFRGYHDFGCDQAEYLAGVKSKGAA